MATKSKFAIGNYVRVVDKQTNKSKTIRITKNNQKELKEYINQHQKEIKEQRTQSKKEAYQKSKERKIITKQANKLMKIENTSFSEAYEKAQNQNKQRKERIENMEHGTTNRALKDANDIAKEIKRVFNSIKQKYLKDEILRQLGGQLPLDNLTVDDIYVYDYTEMRNTAYSHFKQLKEKLDIIIDLLLTEYKSALPDEQEELSPIIAEFENIAAFIESSKTEFNRTVEFIDDDNEPEPPNINLVDLENKNNERY